MGKLVISLQRINNRENSPLLLKFNNFPSKATKLCITFVFVWSQRYANNFDLRHHIINISYYLLIDTTDLWGNHKTLVFLPRL